MKDLNANVNLPATGAVGLEPPPEAPREVSQPLTSDALREMQAKARANERELAPLTFGKTVNPEAYGETGEPVEATNTVQEPKPVQAARGYGAPPVRESHQPAASNSDSPSRGVPGTTPIPAARTTKPLQVTGGFGEAEDEYFPINGAELKEIVTTLLDEVHARIENDMRFGVHLVYPRLTARVLVIVEGEADDSGFEIKKVLPEKGKWDRTPLEVAKEHGDSVCFVVTAQRREFDDTGAVETPAGALRDELNLEGPRKRATGQGVNKTFHDVSW